MKRILLASILIVFTAVQVIAQINPLPLNIQKAYKSKTRSSDGLPGENYWQNHSDYKLEVTVDTEEDKISGKATIQYTNNSPDSLSILVIRLYQDFFRKGNARQWPIPEGDLMEGVSLTNLVVNGNSYDPNSDYPYWMITNFMLPLKEKITPGSVNTIELEWEFDIPTVRGLRMKKYDEGHYFIAYWYPQIAVYDDIDGWDLVDYTGLVEFYNDFNNFDVRLTVPGDFVVWATGELQNAKELFQENIFSRIEKANKSDDVIQIITQTDYDNKAVLKQNKKNTWHFIANDIPDFSFAMSTHSNWDASSLQVDPDQDHRVMINAVYPEGSDHWSKGAEVSRASIDYMSKTLPGVPFPYPQMTSVWGGGRGGGMETPMMANDGSPKRYQDFVELLFHEIAHTYFPFYMGTNERKYAWMDEGWAAYLPNELVNQLIPGSSYMKETCEGYSFFAGQEAELPLMVPSFQNNNFSSARVAAYTRPAMAYHFLRDAMGDDQFKKALREFMSRWHGKHPLPYDFFNTFDEVAGESLDWYWKPWFFEAGYPDLAIKSLTDRNEVIIEKIGTHPIPVSLYYTTEDNESKNIFYSVSIWKEGNSEFRLQLPKDKKITSMKLGNETIPDVVNSNNNWPIK